MNEIENLNVKFDSVIKLLESNVSTKSNAVSTILTTVMATVIVLILGFVWTTNIKVQQVENRLDQTERVRVKGWKAIDYNFKILNVNNNLLMPIYDPEDKTRLYE